MMPKEQANKEGDGLAKLYQGEVSREEAERLAGFDYPNIVSEKFLPEDFSGQWFLDVGAGDNMGLEKIVTERHGIYGAIDINEGLLRKRSGNRMAQADASRLPFGDKSFDMVHIRFVLMHLPLEMREKI